MVACVRVAIIILLRAMRIALTIDTKMKEKKYVRAVQCSAVQHSERSKGRKESTAVRADIARRYIVLFENRYDNDLEHALMMVREKIISNK